MTIETKYNIGETAYYIAGGDWYSGEIIAIFIYDRGIKYAMKEFTSDARVYAVYIEEHDLFPTKEELLRSL